jgi:hypothetical protein
MTTHHSPVDTGSVQPPLPNQHFSSWLRSQTTLFISQIVALLTFVLFVAEEVYYISHVGEQGELLQTLTVRLIVDIAHIVFMTIFALVLIRFLDDNDRGSYRIKLVYKRIFKKPNYGEPIFEEPEAKEPDIKKPNPKDDKTYESALADSKEQLRKFKFRFLWFWIGMLFLYVCFACQHGYKLATSEPKGESTYESHLVVSTGREKESFKTETSYHTTDSPDAQNSTAETKLPKIQSLKKRWDIVKHLAFPFFVFLLNNLTMFFIFLCFLIAYIPATEKSKYRKYRNYALITFFVLTGAFLLLAIPVALMKEFTAIEWNAYSAMFDGISGVLNSIVLALLVARLDSKLVGLPSWLISILYSYAAAQPLFIVFELNQTDAFEKITTAVLIFVFVAKIYFFLIITYALQTGKMLNYLFCFPILHKRAKEPQDVKERDPHEMEPRSEDLESDEGWLMRVIFSRCHKLLGKRLGEKRLTLIRRLRIYLSEKLRSESYFKASRSIGLVAAIVFPICLIFIILIQPAPPFFSGNDLKNAHSLALKLRAPGPLSEYLVKNLADEAKLKWKKYNSAGLSSTAPEEVLIEALNGGITDPKLFTKERFEGVNFRKATTELQKNNLQGNALIGLNRLLLEDAYPDELLNHSENKPRAFTDIVSNFLATYVKRGSDFLHLLLIFIICVILYLVRTDNRYGGRRSIKTPESVFKDTLKSDYTPAAGKKQLTKFKEYFFYFWLAMFFLYLVLLLQHLGLKFDPANEKTIMAMIKVLVYPFLEFLFSSLNLLFIFWCFVILRSPAFNKRAKTRQKVLINYSTFVVALLIAAFPLLVFVVGGPKLSEAELRGYATVFDGVAGVLSAVGWALLIARMDSKLFGLPMWSMGILFAYASIQPLFVVFALNDAVLGMVQTSVLLTAFLLKICFFLIITHSLQSGKALNYLLCFPFLKERVDSIFENQFEIRLALARHEDKFVFSILKKNQLYYSSMIRFDSRRECDGFIHDLRTRMEKREAYSDPPFEESGAYWVEVKTADPERLICESIPLRSAKEALDLIDESMEKIPYCKYNRA